MDHNPTADLTDDNPFETDYQLARCAAAGLDALDRLLRMRHAGVMVPRPDEFFAAPTEAERDESRRFLADPRQEG